MSSLLVLSQRVIKNNFYENYLLTFGERRAITKSRKTKGVKEMYVYGNQQTNEQIKSNSDNWVSLHTNKEDYSEMVRYNKDRIRKHKIRLIEGWRK